MATDATGTPTSPDSIPTYATSADAPSGKGFNAAMAAIQTALSARWLKSLFTTTGDIAYASSASTPARLGIGSTGNVLTVAGGLPTWAPAAGITTYRKTTTKTVSNTVTETDLLNSEITIAANAMGASGLIRGNDIIADILSNNSGNFRFRLKLGATTLIDTGANFAPANNASRTWLDIRFRILNLAATNSQVAWMWVSMPAGLDTFGPAVGAGGTGGTASPYHFAAWNTAAVDTTASQALALTVQHSGASVNQDAKLYGAVIEVV